MCWLPVHLIRGRAVDTATVTRPVFSGEDLISSVCLLRAVLFELAGKCLKWIEGVAWGVGVGRGEGGRFYFWFL